MERVVVVVNRIFLFQRLFKHALVILAISAVAVLSLLPYIPAYSRARDWNILVRGAPTSYSLWKHFEVALGNPVSQYRRSSGPSLRSDEIQNDLGTSD